jgi:hypothetical protein
MTTATSREELIDDSPSDFFEAMECPNNAPTDILNDNLAPKSFEPSVKINGPIGSLLSNPRLKVSSSDGNFWNGYLQSDVVATVKSTLAPLGGDQSYDTRYISQKDLSGRSLLMDMPYQALSYITTEAASTTSKSRKCSGTKGRKSTNRKKLSTKNNNTKDVIGKRSRKARRISESLSANLLLKGEGDDTKREQFLARNREAASKCRQKKKEWTQDLEQKARDLSAQKQMLTTCLAALKNELLMLKCKCLEHSDCACEGIRDYLTNTVTIMLPANAALYSRLEDEMPTTELVGDSARKKSSASCIDMDAMSTPGDMVTSPSSACGDAGPIRPLVP